MTRNDRGNSDKNIRNGIVEKVFIDFETGIDFSLFRNKFANSFGSFGAYITNKRKKIYFFGVVDVFS